MLDARPSAVGFRRMTVNVRNGSTSDLGARNRKVRTTPGNGHHSSLCHVANKGHRSKLQPAFDGVEGEATYREKVDAAVEWGKIYLNPLKSEKYSGGREQVRGFLLQDLALAAKIAGDIM